MKNDHLLDGPPMRIFVNFSAFYDYSFVQIHKK